MADEQILDPMAARQLRGLILTLVYVNHRRQGARLTSTVIRGTLQREGYQFSRNDVLAMLQDLKDRDYLRYRQMRGDDERLFIFEIEITSSGRDLVDGYETDQAVLTK
jgi:hypothetical protein